jgi:hypothetical protein
MSRSKSHAVTLVSCIAISITAILLASCGKKSPDGEKKAVQKSQDDFVDKNARQNELRGTDFGFTIAISTNASHAAIWISTDECIVSEASTV